VLRINVGMNMRLPLWARAAGSNRHPWSLRYEIVGYAIISKTRNHLAKYRWLLTPRFYDNGDVKLYACRTVKLRMGRKTIMLHRDICEDRGEDISGKSVMHWPNQDGLDCRDENIMVDPGGKNRQDGGKAIGTSQFKGVWRLKPTHSWHAEIRVGNPSGKGRSPHLRLGCFPTEEDAAKAYDAKARELFGKFARLNFPGPGERGIKD